jgi:hypothetical protein|tara:strand:+ start:664 stop:810 length:147 start_codon:yes stop_codon:yes gene_type:complete
MKATKTALKWTEDGELSAVDMARILEAMDNVKLKECKLNEREVEFYEW